MCPVLVDQNNKSKQGIKFNSLLIPPYLKRTESIEELLPVLYLKGFYVLPAIAASND
jgi:hypothetical protein